MNPGYDEFFVCFFVSNRQFVLKLGIPSAIYPRVLSSYNSHTVFRLFVMSASIVDKVISTSAAICVLIDPYSIFIKRASLADCVFCLFARPQYPKSRRTCAAFFANNIRRQSARKDLEFIQTTSGATFACSAARGVLRVCSFSAFYATRLFILVAHCGESCGALFTSQVDQLWRDRIERYFCSTQ